MSNTPRTDKEAFDITTGKPDIDGVVMADFARELELELNEQVLLNGKGSEREYILLGKIERLERENAALRSELKRQRALWQATYALGLAERDFAIKCIGTALREESQP